MRHRLFVASLLLLLALPLVPMPAAAQPAQPVATTTLTDEGGCSVRVTYTWSGFNGQNLIAQYGVVWPAGGGAQYGLIVQVRGVTGSSGTLSETFDLTGYGTNAYSGRGYLLKTNGRKLDGSDVVSTSTTLSC